MTSPASVDTPAPVDKAEPVAVSAPSAATPMPGAEPSPAAEAASEEPASLASEIARRRLGARLRRIRPFFAGTRRGFILAFVGAVVAAATEPAIPALLKIILDDGMKRNGFPLWLVPIAIIGLTVIRGLAGFVSQYGLTWSASRATQAMRRAMFQRVLDAEPLLFTRNTASNLVNTLTFEVQAGATQLVYSV